MNYSTEEFLAKLVNSDTPRQLVDEIGASFTSSEERLCYFVEACDMALRKGQQQFGMLLNLFCTFLVGRGDIDSAHSIIFRYQDSNLAVIPINQSQIMFRRGNIDSAIDFARKIKIKCNWSASIAANLLLTYHDWAYLGETLGKIEKHARPDVFREILNKFQIFTRHNVVDGFNASVPIFCINLDRDEHRFIGLEKLYGKTLCKTQRLPGVLGSSVPMLMRKSVFRTQLPPNSIGCWTSQIRALERVVESGEDYGLIIEDDGLPAFQFSFSRLLEVAPKDFDICFLNDRSIPGWWLDSNRKLDLLNVNEVYSDVAESVRAIGADGYLVSRVGAEKILEDLARNGAAKHYDWQIYSYGIGSISPDDDRHVSKIIRSTRQISSSDLRLNSYVSSIPFVVHRPMGFNARIHFSANA
ncbi:hypothetical protein [Microbulbifer sp. ARAS458-1]|uniref:hypothetical protein n=1 Tax=Microbulbifer sp. ARAS458-1 TaxID=3140242 RepID=UPI0038783CE6